MKPEEARKILTKLRVNYPSSFSNMTSESGAALLEIWADGLAEVDSQYAAKALRYFLFETTSRFAPTIGEFLEQCRRYRAEYEKENPVIRNMWEEEDDQLSH